MINNKGVNRYYIDYIEEVSSDFGGWSDLVSYAEGWDVGYQLCTGNVTVTIVIPKGYDGLALRVIPETEGPDPDTEFNVFDNDKEEYIMDNW